MTILDGIRWKRSAPHYECPVDLRDKTIQVRYDRMRRNRFVVYFDGHRMGEATVLDLVANARLRLPAAIGGYDD